MKKPIPNCLNVVVIQGVNSKTGVKLHVKNMVCDRCKMVVKSELESLGLHPVSVELGEVLLKETQISSATLHTLEKQLENAGFAVLDDKTTVLVEKVKNEVIRWIHEGHENPGVNFSTHISSVLHREYSHISKLFSETAGVTLEQYMILQRVEKVKELIVYDEMTLSEIAFSLDYSSTAHLSRQFKSVTGFTPSEFRKLRPQQRKSLDRIG